MAIFETVGPCDLGRFLARDSSHRNGAPNFGTSHRRSHATGHHKSRQQPKDRSCKTRIDGRSFHRPLMLAWHRQIMERRGFQRGRISAKKEGWACKDVAVVPDARPYYSSTSW